MIIEVELHDGYENRLRIDVGDSDGSKPWTGRLQEHEPVHGDSRMLDEEPRSVGATAVSEPLAGRTSTLTIQGHDVTGTPFVDASTGQPITAASV